MQRGHFVATAAVSALLVLGLTAGQAMADATDVPAPGKSKKIDAIKARGSLKAAAIGEFPWLPENTSGSGEQFSGPAWVLANEYAKRLGVKLENLPLTQDDEAPNTANRQARDPSGPPSAEP